MIDIFWLQVFLAFFIGGIWIAFSTVLADKYGTKIGGLVAGLPSTAVVAYLFVGITQSAAIAAESTIAMPIVEGFDAIFLVLYAFLGGGLVALSLSLLLWFFLSSTLLFFDLTYGFSLAAYLVIFIGSYYLMKKMNIKSHGKLKVKYSLHQILGRATFSGLIIAGAVVLAKYGGPLLGGIFVAFPASFLSTLVITLYSRGKEFSRAIAKPMLLSGMIVVVIYSIGVRYFYPAFGLVWGTLFSYLVSIIAAYLVYLFIQKKMI